MQTPLPGRHSGPPAGVGVHAFPWGTLTEDGGILELIPSWKQTQGDSVWGVILLWPCCGWRMGWLAGPWLGHDWVMAGSWQGHGWVMAGQGGSALGELLNPAQQMKTERKIKAQRET